MTTSSDRRPNVLLVVIDALRAGNLGCYGAGQDPTPNIDAIAREGVLFQESYCTWNTTDPSLTAILSGKYPLSHGITNHGDKVTAEHLRVFASTHTRLASEILREHGYSTFAVDWMMRWYRRGFDTYTFPADCSLPGRIGRCLRYVADHKEILRLYARKRRMGLPSLADIAGILGTFVFSKTLAETQNAGALTDCAVRLLREMERERPFFMFLHYWDTHTPYPCPGKWLKRTGLTDEEKLTERYTGAIRNVDYHLGRLVRELRASCLLDDTLLIVTSDHGESLTEHGIFFDHHGLYDETIHVPLIVRHPLFLPQGKEQRGLVQSIDILPTILDLIDCEEKDIDGVSLLPLMTGRVSECRPFIYTEEAYVQNKRALRTRTHKYIMSTDGVGSCRYCRTVHGGTEELYDLAADPTETRNVLEQEPELAQELRERMQATIGHLLRKRQARAQNSGGQRGGPAQEKADAQVRKRLRSLGYFG